MIFLTTIVFIAELIILSSLVSCMIKTDKKVCLLTESVNKGHVKLKWRLQAIGEITAGINEIFPILIKKLKRTRKNIIIRLVNQIFQGAVFLLFKPKYKKLLFGAKAGIGMLKKYLKI